MRPWTESLEEFVSELRALGAFPELGELLQVDERELGEAGA